MHSVSIPSADISWEQERYRHWLNCDFAFFWHGDNQQPACLFEPAYLRRWSFVVQHITVYGVSGCLVCLRRRTKRSHLTKLSGGYFLHWSCSYAVMLVTVACARSAVPLMRKAVYGFLIWRRCQGLVMAENIFRFSLNDWVKPLMSLNTLYWFSTTQHEHNAWKPKFLKFSCVYHMCVSCQWRQCAREIPCLRVRQLTTDYLQEWNWLCQVSSTARTSTPAVTNSVSAWSSRCKALSVPPSFSFTARPPLPSSSRSAIATNLKCHHK